MAIPLILSMLQAGATIGTGLWQFSENQKAREEARNLANKQRADTIKQQKIDENFKRQQLGMQAKELRRQRQMDKMAVADMERQEKEGFQEYQSSMLSMGETSRKDKATENLGARLERIGRL